MQVLLINPAKKKKKSKKSKKRGAAMAKKKRKTTKRKTVAKRKVRATVRRRKIRARRNPSMNPIIAYAIGGVTGLTTSKLIDSIKPVTLPLGITGGNITSAAVGYLMYSKGRGMVRQIGVGHLASSLGLIAVNLIDGLTGGKILKGGLHSLEENFVVGEDGQIYMLDGIPEEEPQVLDGVEGLEEQIPELQIIG